MTNYFKSSFEARFVRISPRSWHKNPALRIELFTDCDTSLVSNLYSMLHFKTKKR